MTSEDEVGPVFNVRSDTPAYVAAIRRCNPDANVVERGTYVRILVPRECVIRRDVLSEELGTAACWPECLESIMPSFKGRLSITSDFAEWR
jgi:hypothetical protein